MRLFILIAIGSMPCARAFWSRTTPKTKSCQVGPSVDFSEHLSCLWPDNSLKWWSDQDPYKKYSRQHDKWEKFSTSAFAKNYKNLAMAKFYDHKKAKICTTSGTAISVTKVKADTKVGTCHRANTRSMARNPLDFKTARNLDFQAVASNPINAINFASLYRNKLKQSQKEASAEGHPEWMFGDLVNYDHIPPKGIYKRSKTCSRGYQSAGSNLPTLVVLALDHKGPVWSACTTGRSVKSDNSRKSVAKMTKFAEDNQFGRAILENLGCLLENSVKIGLPQVFTDYHQGFLHLMQLHYEVKAINSGELSVLREFLDYAKSSPKAASGSSKFASFDSRLAKSDTYMKPRFC